MSGTNVYICGPPKCGKTTTINAIMSMVSTPGCMCAGLARGHYATPFFLLKNIEESEHAPPIVFIDNIHEWSARTFTRLDVLLRIVSRRAHVPFGGSQIICAGDAARISDRPFFDSSSWPFMEPVDILYDPSPHARAIIASRRNEWAGSVCAAECTPREHPPIVLTNEKRAIELNNAEADRCDARLSSRPRMLAADEWAISPYYRMILIKEMKKRCIPRTLRLHKGYVVRNTMLVRNKGLLSKHRWVVLDVKRGEVLLKRTTDGFEMSMNPVICKCVRDKTVVAFSFQYPLEHAWATSDAHFAMDVADPVRVEEYRHPCVLSLLIGSRLCNPEIRSSDVDVYPSNVASFVRKTERDHTSGMDTVVSMESSLQAREETE
jgi:hypothetical protein